MILRTVTSFGNAEEVTGTILPIDGKDFPSAFDLRQANFMRWLLVVAMQVAITREQPSRTICTMQARREIHAFDCSAQ